MNRVLSSVWGSVFVAWSLQAGLDTSSVPAPVSGLREFSVRGVIKSLDSEAHTVLIQHEAISNYMDAMTMPFKVRDPKELANLGPGDQVSFQLFVTSEESWIARLTKTGSNKVASVRADAAPRPPASQPSHHPLLDYKFTNELGQAVSLSQFKGQALAITFFFTRCPLPDYCPRLSKNFEEAARSLSAMPSAPTNWHLISVSFDTAFDTPNVLKSYGDLYHYDPAHWSFLTGPEDKIVELARQSNVNVQREGDFFNHNFRTLIIDAAGHLQMAFPVGGNLSDAIVREILKGVGATNALSVSQK